MAPTIPPVEVLRRPEPLRERIDEDRAAVREDCLPCRAMGAGAFIGLGVYSYVTSHKNLELQRAQILKSGSRFGMKSRAMGINGMAMTFIAMGLYRFFN